MTVTKLTDMINPQVMADMISAKIQDAIVVSPFATIDNTLQGQPGSTITVPRYNYIGDAVDVAEGTPVTPVKLTTKDVEYTIKKAMQAVTLTDEALLSGYGNPMGQTTSQLALALASKMDVDALTALLAGTHTYTANAVIGYGPIVDAIDVFGEEFNTSKVIFINPKQVTQLRHDPDFISADKYDAQVIMRGEIGTIANTRVVPSRRIKASGGSYKCPIVKVETDTRTEDDATALTIFLKRDTNLETERHTLERTTDISVDKHYVAALTNDNKVVVATFKETAGA